MSSTNSRHFIIVGVLVLISTIILDWLLKWAMPLPIQASLEALTIDWLIGLHLTIIAFLFALVMVFMLYALIVFRRKEGDEEEGEHFHGNTKLEIFWTAAPLVAVIAFIFIGLNTSADIMKAEDNELVIQVEGFQWGWSFTYPDGFISGELVLPVDQHARMEMTSKDVLHDFWIPEFRVKQDLVPGTVQILRFTPSLVGEYTLRCAEICGLSHWKMLADVRVVEQAEYDQWVSEQVAELQPAVVQAKD